MSVIHDALEKLGGFPSPGKDGKKKGSETFKQIIQLISPRYSKRRQKRVMAGAFCMLILFAFVMLFWIILPAKKRNGESEAFQAASRYFGDSSPQNTGQAGLVLNGVIAGDQKMALINNKLVSQGERIDGILVKDIQDKKVTLEFKGKEIYLSL